MWTNQEKDTWTNKKPTLGERGKDTWTNRKQTRGQTWKGHVD